MIFMLVMLLYGLISTVPESSLYLLFFRSSLYSLSDWYVVGWISKQHFDAITPKKIDNDYDYDKGGET